MSRATSKQLLGMLVVATSVQVACSKSTDPPGRTGSRDASSLGSDDPADIREYRGDPSSVVCGVRWSHDHSSVYCDRSRVSLNAFVPFDGLTSLTLDDVTVEAGEGALPRLPSVTNLRLNEVSVPTRAIVSAFPGVQWLGLSGTALSFADLREWTQLESVIIDHVDAPEAQALLAFPKLRFVSLAYLRCPEPRCEFRLGWELKAARPDMEVKVMGRELKPERDAGPGSGT